VNKVMIAGVPSHAEDFTEHYRQTLVHGVTSKLQRNKQNGKTKAILRNYDM